MGTERRLAFAVLLAVLAAMVGVSAPAPACAQERDATGWAIERAAMHFAVFEQEGHGAQSVAPTDDPLRGSEHAWIFQTIGALRVRQNEHVVHDLVVPIDIVTAASPDALDATTSASRENEAGGLDIVSSVHFTEDDTLRIHWGAHLEEPMGSLSLGLGLDHELADDNATLHGGFEVIYDLFDAIEPDGDDPGRPVPRFTASFSTGVSQLLSPTTIATAGYTATLQTGRLETTYNSVPAPDGTRVGDLFPTMRGRHAFVAAIRQAFPETRTYLAASYRLYTDSFDVIAHTPRLEVTQYVGDVWLRAYYRFHTQTAPSFWSGMMPIDAEPNDPRTADSDLERFHAHELGGSVRWFLDREGALTASSSFVDVGYMHYWRSNSLKANMVSLSFGLAL